MSCSASSFFSRHDSLGRFVHKFAFGESERFSLCTILANLMRHGARLFCTALQVFSLHIMLVSSTYTLGGALGNLVCNSSLDLFSNDLVMGHDCLQPANML